MTTAITKQLPTVPQKVEIDPDWVARRDKLIEEAKGVTEISDNDAYEQAETALKRITSSSNELEKFRKDFAKPFREAEKQIKTISDEAREPLEEEKQRLKKVMQSYLDEIERKRQEEIEKQAEEQRKKQEQAAESGNPFEEIAAETNEEVQPTTQDVRKSMSRSQKVTKFEITNPKKVPREFCSPDEKKIRQATKQGVTEIPGVKIWEETQVMSR